MIKVYNTGYCTQKINGINYKFYSVVVLIKHKKCNILFDSGYSDFFIKETKKYPYNLYLKATPVFYKPQDSILKQLNKDGISENDIKFVVISHLHGDHIGGLKYFSKAKFIISRVEYSKRILNGLKALRKAFIPNLLPNDFDERIIFLDELESKQTIDLEWYYYDLFGDDKIKIIKLPGHTIGQIGLLFNNYFFVADSSFFFPLKSKLSLKERIVTEDNFSYQLTINKIKKFKRKNEHIKILPSHSEEILCLN